MINVFLRKIGCLVVIVGCTILPFLSNAQKTPFLPQALSDAVNSDYTEIKPLLTENDSTLFFIRVDHPSNKWGTTGSQDIWWSHLQNDGTWSYAERLPDVVNRTRYNAIYGVYDNGKSILINGVFAKNGKWKQRGVSVVHRNGNTWTEPESIDFKAKHINDGLTVDYMLNHDGNVMFVSSSRMFGSKKNELYVSVKKHGKWKKPKRIKTNIGKSAISPFLASDNKHLYFSAKETEDGSYQIYETYRIDKTYRRWSGPIALSSDTINDFNAWDGYLSLNEKEDIAFFASDREEKKNIDIYRVRLFEDEPWAEFEGHVMNGLKNTIMPEKEFKLVVEQYASATDSLSSDSIISEWVIQPDSLYTEESEMSFQFQLPFGEHYRVRAVVENYIDVPVDVNLEEKYEHYHETLNLNVLPLSYAMLKGKVVDRKGDSTMTNPYGQMYVTLNGLPYDSATIMHDGTFEFKVALGDSFIVEANKPGFKSIPLTLDLSDKEEYVEIEKNLYIEKLPDMNAYVTYALFNKSTQKAIDTSVVITMFINDKLYKAFKYGKRDTSNNEVLVRLPLDSLYKIKIEPKGFIDEVDSVNLVGETSKMKISKQLYFVPIEIGQSVVLKNIQFELGKATLKEESYANLDVVADFLMKHGNVKIEVGGHTDNQGSDKLNKQLSKNRAESVVNYLASQGISKERLTYEGYGFDKPIADNKTEEGRALNRRVEFTIVGK